MALLENIKNPSDIKSFSAKKLDELAGEIRHKIIEVVAQNGGHLSPSLGVVELTLALHKVFDFSRDKIVWDVGHQCYAHKLITGRYSSFHTLRQEGGISGFPKRDESEYDHFDTGHAGTSISAASGFAAARDFSGSKHKIIAVIGDGSMTSGLALEGLNNAGAQKTNLIVILNDNEMSISPNVGALSEYLNRIITGELYNKVRGEVDSILAKIPAVGPQVSSLAHRVAEAVKGILVPGRFFEDLGFKYFGPIAGHKLPFLIETLESVKKLSGPRLIHVVTTKGKGYRQAEEQPGAWHGTAPFNISTGKREKSSKASYTSIFGSALVKLAEEDEKIVAITAAMKDGTGLVEFGEKFPERLFDVGIAEQHAVTFSAALAVEGYKPVVAIYSTFMQRAYDQVLHDVCNMNLPVTFALDRAGIVGDDGPTHQGVFDFSFLRHIPNMTVMAPKDENELRHMVYTALNYRKPCAVRFPRGQALGVPLDQTFRKLEIGKAELLKEGSDILICAIGNRVASAEKAAQKLEREGYSVALINARFVKPLDIDLISTWARKCGCVLTVEENALMGGFGSAVFEELRKAGLGNIAGASLGVPDIFVEHASQESSREKFGLSAEGICMKAKEFLKIPREVASLQERRTLQERRESGH